ncbi:MAG: glycosyl transferase [Oscillospiraceae bacterium]|nr:glycosyl transferase [Oscillospiraceae bacterium]
MTIKQIFPRKYRGKLMDALMFLPDKPYIRLFYYAATGKFPNLKNPKGYNEKLQWLKLHDRHPEYTTLADKLAVKDYIDERLGKGYCFTTLGTWNSFDEIDFGSLPNRFVLKCNHDSGSVKIIHDKSRLTAADYKELRDFYQYRLKYDFFYAGREYPYRNIPRRIMAEEYMENTDCPGQSLADYKFFCFDGEPKLLLLASGRGNHHHSEDYFDMDFNHLSEIRNGWEPSAVPPKKPKCFEEMKQMAAILSAGITHVRMDFYEIGGKPYFGEYTFFSGGGYELFRPEEWEQRLGDWIHLP